MSKKKKPAGGVVQDVPAVGTDWEPTEAPVVGSDGYALASGQQTQPNPLAAVEYSGNAETDSAAEMAALQTGFAERAKQDAARRLAAVDSEYWCCLCFQSREQKEAFLAFMDWLTLGDKYLDGVEVARRMGTALPLVENLRFVPARPDRALSELALPLEGEA